MRAPLDVGAAAAAQAGHGQLYEAAERGELAVVDAVAAEGGRLLGAATFTTPGRWFKAKAAADEAI